mmetsp:Transcript_24932/g.40180  ORF Transcript_24932/g.40180 Transcript_24932/m.40180 type:complete len:204 (+) Transcript_24932:76-687(+)|eukprot:jgi/Bigna1/89002/estExt_fgenesh1_pg.C_420048
MDFSFQAALVGPAENGKAKLLDGILGDSKSPARHSSSSEVVMKEKMLKGDDHVYLVQFFNIPGKQRFLRHAPFYCAGCSAIIFCFDESVPSSFDHLKDWISTTLQDHEDSPVKLLINFKGEGRLQVDTKNAIALAQKYAMDFFEVDLSKGQGIKTALKSMITSVSKLIPKPMDPSNMIGKNIKICAKLFQNSKFAPPTEERAY